MNWLDLIWTVVLYGLVFAILWWAVNLFAAKIASPFGTIAQVVLVAAIVVVSIGVLMGSVPLIPFGHVGSIR